VDEAISVAQFMDGFLEEALLQKLRIIGQTVEFVIQAIRTDNRASAVQSRLAENECKDGNEQVEPRNAEHLGCSPGVVLFQLLNNRGRIVLVPVKIKEGMGIELALRNVHFCMKAGSEQSAQAHQLVLKRKVNGNQEHHYDYSGIVNIDCSWISPNREKLNPKPEILIPQPVFLDFVVNSGSVNVEQLRGQRYVSLRPVKSELDVELLHFCQGQNLLTV
jgi:hypothetical protein